MSKNKPKDSKKNKASGDLLDSATLGLQQFRRFAKQVQKLSTTQKIVGGLAVLAAGYALITNSSPVEAPAATAALDEPTPPVVLATPNPTPQARIPQPKRAIPAGHSKHIPFSEEHS